MKTLLAILMLTTLCGCASIPQGNAAVDAVKNGRISGIAATDHFSIIPWAFPSTYMGPYSDIAGFSGWRTNDAHQAHTFIFFVGKRTTTKEWEVFSVMTWTNGEWQLLPVTLPKQNKK